MSQSKTVSCTLLKGHQVASGQASDTPYPAGSIELQLPHFKALGLDLSEFYLGTLNLSIAPQSFKILKPLFKFERVIWIEGFPPETFSFVDCSVWYGGSAYFGYLYYPHPETKTQHFHNDQLIEVICQKIPDINYGAQLTLEYDPLELQII